MSQLMTVELPFECAEDIIKVLDHFKLHYERSEEGISLRGYGGAVSRRKANIVVSREQFEGSSDLGFRQNSDGKWEMEVDNAHSGMATDIKNVHAYLKVQEIIGRKRKKAVVEGVVPTRLQRRMRGQQDEIRITVSV